MTDFHIDMKKLQKALDVLGINNPNGLEYLAATAERHVDELLNAVIEKDRQRRAFTIRRPPELGAKRRPADELGWYDADVWIEVGHDSEHGAELRIAFGEPLPNGYRDFWIPFSGPDGSALGWMCFRYLTTVRRKSLFAATQWRSASEPAPAEQDQLPLALGRSPAGINPKYGVPKVDLLEPINPAAIWAATAAVELRCPEPILGAVSNKSEAARTELETPVVSPYQAPSASE